jgi:hypothetical protein
LHHAGLRGFKHTEHLFFSAINATSITVTLAEAQDAVPAVDKFTVTVNDTANAVKEVKAVAGDTTKKNFVLTLTDSLSNKEGVLKVNNFTPSNISGADFNFDFKAPTVESVTALNSTTVEVKFSEKLNKAESEKTAAYKLARVSGVTAPPVIQTAVLAADGKTITLTLATPLVDSPNGYVLTINGDITTPANNTVADVKGNKLAVSERIFSGVATPDQTKPTLAKAAYDKTTGVLVLTLNKIVVVADGNVNETGITIKGANGSYKLLETDYVPTTSTNSNQITMVLSAASKTAVAALGDTLTLDVAAEVFTDTNATPLKNDAITDFPVEQTAAPKLASANFDQATRILTLTFTESDLNIQKVDISKLSLGGTALNKTKSKLLTTANGKTIVIEVQTDINVTSATTLALTAAFAENTAGTPVVPVTSQALTFVADTAKPLLTSASYNDGTGELVLNFNENVTVASITAAVAANKISLTDAKAGTTPVALTAYNAGPPPSGTSVNTTTDGKTIRLQVQGTEKNAVDALELTTLKLVIAADSFKDLAGNGNKAIAAADNFMVTYIDKTAPALNLTFNTTGFIVTAKGLTLQFTEKVNKAQAETASNYEIKSGLVDLAVTSAKLRADGKTVDLVTAEQSNLTYTVKISNVTDLAGNAYVNPTTLPSFVGNATATDKTSPELETAVYIDNGDSQPSAGDKIKLTFDEPLATVAADLTAAKLGLTISKLSSSINLTAAGTTFAYGANNQELVITLGSAPTAPFANGPLDVTIDPTNTSLKDAAGNVAKNSGTKTIASPGGDLKIVATKYIDDGNHVASAGDKVEVQFNQAVSLGTATNIDADNVLASVELASLGLVSADKGVIKPGTDNTLVFTKSDTTAPAFDNKIGGKTAPELTSKWGAQLTVLDDSAGKKKVDAGKADATNATLTSASYNKTTGKLTVKFNKTLVAKNAAATDLKSEFVFLSGGVSTTVTDLNVDTAKDTLTNELVFTVVNAADKDYFASGVAQLQIKPGGTDAATNVYKAKVLPASAPITVTVTE